MKDIFEVLDNTNSEVLEEIRKIKNGAEVSENYATRLKDEISNLNTALKALENMAVDRVVTVKMVKFRQALDDLMEVADIFICPSGSDEADPFLEEDEFKKIEKTYDFYVNAKKE